MLQYTEEILDYDDLVENNNYYVKFDDETYYNYSHNIKLAEKYDGIYKLHNRHNCNLTNEIIDESNENRIKILINENNVELCLYKYNIYDHKTLKYHYTKVCELLDLDNMTVQSCKCKIYKENETEYVLK
jgi:hypothetical protein